MLAAEPAIFVHFQSVGIILLILHGVVVALFALAAGQRDPCSHGRAPPFRPSYAPCYYFLHKKKDLIHQHKNYITCHTKCQEAGFKFYHKFTKEAMISMYPPPSRLHARVKNRQKSVQQPCKPDFCAAGALTASVIAAAIAIAAVGIASKRHKRTFLC